MAKRINLDLVLLRKLYEDDKLAIRDIAIVMKCSETKIRRELNKLGFNLGAVNPFAREDIKAKIKQTIKD
ncbi:MAG: hypothetical protein IJH34_18090, partial [Romboutsia sp.]|nr:hypothetical protein [Romboutsia sp.]